MKPLFHPQLIHDPFGDPGLYVEFRFENRALLFDMGDLSPLSPRKILKTSHIFVSHTHMDHFIGFDQVLRICLGREKMLHLFGPPGFADRVAHKLAAYTWNLVENYPADFHVMVTEVGEGRLNRSRFRCRAAFRREEITADPISDGLLLDEPGFRVRSACLDHKVPCLAYTLEEKVHVNILKNRLEAMGLPVGPWLKGLKEAVIRREADEMPFRAWWKREGKVEERWLPLGHLKQEILQIVPGEKITYITDVVYHKENVAKIINLARGSDLLFIESTFLQEDANRAAEKYHLTTSQAGQLGREAGVRRLIPFHFSAKYHHDGTRLMREVEAAFAPPIAAVPEGGERTIDAQGASG